MFEDWLQNLENEAFNKKNYDQIKNQLNSQKHYQLMENYGKKIYDECIINLKPLIKQLKNESLNIEILDSVYVLVQYCIMKEYVKANDIYMALCIGNSPWPIGVTMVGIHERSGRSKISTSKVAHILNDETQRKYLQSIKRLISVC